MTRYEVEVDELVLRGLPAPDARALAAEVERLLAERAEREGARGAGDGGGPVPAGWAVDRVRVGPLPADERGLAGQVADAIWHAVRDPASSGPAVVP